MRLVPQKAGAGVALPFNSGPPGAGFVTRGGFAAAAAILGRRLENYRQEARPCKRFMAGCPLGKEKWREQRVQRDEAC